MPLEPNFSIFNSNNRGTRQSIFGSQKEFKELKFKEEKLKDLQMLLEHIHQNLNMRNGGQIYLLKLWIRFMGGLLLHFVGIEIKGEDQTLKSWNFIIKLSRSSYVESKNYLAS